MVPQVLIIGADAQATHAAYMAVEASGWTAVTITSDASPAQAVERLLPAYVLLDVSHPAASDGALYMMGIRCHTRILLYGTQAETLSMLRIAVRFGATTIDVPFDAVAFASAVEHRIDAEEWLAGWLSSRRCVDVKITRPHYDSILEL